MRLLFVSNFFPPYAQGGYEQWCDEVAVAMAQRGHAICILTSRPPRHASANERSDIDVQRLLHLEVDSSLLVTSMRRFKQQSRHERDNLKTVENIVTQFRPDAALIWGMWNISRDVPHHLERLLPARVAYYLCDYWLTLPSAYVQQWQTEARRTMLKLSKRILHRMFATYTRKHKPPILKLEHPICVSRAVREILIQHGLLVEYAAIVYGGVDLAQFTYSAPSQERRPLRLLYAGRLTADKGIETALRAMEYLRERADPQFTLDVFGKGSAEYERNLKKFVSAADLQKQVIFRGSVPHSQMKNILHDFDALVFPSEWPEPFARVVLEAMASGLVVIGTCTGGTGEALLEGETGLTFESQNAHQLAEQILRLNSAPNLRYRLAHAARHRVQAKFTFERMVNALELKLIEMRDGCSD